MEASNRERNHDYIGELYIEASTKKVKWKPNAKLNPIYEFPLRGSDDLAGCVIIYEMPYEDSPFILNNAKRTINRLEEIDKEYDKYLKEISV